MPCNKALFLDRDGVINIEGCYVHTRDTFQFQDGIFDLCRAAQALEYLLVVATNQAGIARGYYTEGEYLELTDWMLANFLEQQIQIARVYHCPYHPIHGLGEYRRDSFDRKPNPGMLLRAKEEFDLDLASCVLIGDKLSDIAAGQAAGVGTTILLDSSHMEGFANHGGYYISSSLHNIRRHFLSCTAPTLLADESAARDDK